MQASEIGQDRGVCFRRRADWAERFVDVEDEVVLHRRVLVFVPVHDVVRDPVQVEHESFVYFALADVLGGGIHPRVCDGAERNGVTHAVALYGLNIFTVEVSVMIHTKTEIVYARHRPKKTASLAVMRRHVACFICICT